jgi:phosphate-selective porin OprO/OprP
MRTTKPRSPRLCLGILVLLILQPSLRVHAADPVKILIRNVLMIDREGETEDVVVQILITGGKLDVVTKDEISAEEATLAVDAQEGVLLGALHVGEPASFLILDQDPREDVEVLLDTKAHTRFAIHEGVILKNTLQQVADVEPEPTEKPKKKSGWLAYSPPPLAMPLSYQDSTKWNKWETKYVSGLFLAALIVDRQWWPSQNSASQQQVGDLGDFEGGEIRGLRFGAVGTLNFKKPWVYTVFAATNAFEKGFESDRDDDISFFDYRLDIPVAERVTLSVGKQKEPISLERIMSLVFLPMQERAAVSDALLPSRNFGAVFSGTGFDQRMSWGAGVFDDSFVTGDNFGDSASQVVGRVTGLPFLTEDESNLIHVGFGLRYSNAEEGARPLTEPEFNNAPLFVDTGAFPADGAVAYNLELSWRKGPVWVGGEYLGTRVDSPANGDPDFGGYHVTASWALTGEMRSYIKNIGIFSPLPVSKSVYQGGWGAWETAIRWSEVDLTDGAVDGGEMGILSLGLNWWLSPIFNVNLNYRHITLDRFGLEGESDGFAARVVLMLE